MLCNNKDAAWQGEDRDSSDEEWDAAFAALDPISRIGWANTTGRAPEFGAHLVRDVFVAADELHVNAMSSIDGNTAVDGMDCEDAADDAGVESRTGGTEGAADAGDNVDDESEGQSLLPAHKPTQYIAMSSVGRPGRPMAVPARSCSSNNHIDG